MIESWLYSAELWGLFGSSLIASTLMPGGSEVYLGYLLSQQLYPLWLLVAVATLGNTLGGLISWLMGYWLACRFPLKRLSERQQQARTWIQRRGYPVLLLSWLPVIGDPLCLISGWLKMNLWFSALLILVGKLLRYLAVSGGVVQWQQLTGAG